MPNQSQGQTIVSIRISCSRDARATYSEHEESCAERIRNALIDLLPDDSAQLVNESAGDIVVGFDAPESALMISRRMQQFAAAKAHEHGVIIKIGLVAPDERQTAGNGDASLAIAKSRELARLASSSQTLACLSSAADFDLALRDKLSEVDPDEWREELCDGRGKVYAVSWQEDVATRLAPAIGAAQAVTRVGKLRLRWRNEQMVLQPDTSRITIGRGGDVDIAIESDFASRDHAHVDYLHSCFVLADHSTNGTYVQIDDSEVFIHDDELILRGEGWISLGRRPRSTAGKVVYFWAEGEADAQ